MFELLLSIFTAINAQDLDTYLQESGDSHVEPCNEPEPC